MFSKIAFFCVFFICNLNVIMYAAQPMRVIAHNVGQGNCISVNCPKNNSLLIDCGSSEHNDNNRPVILNGPPGINIRYIKNSIRKLAGIKPITIIISHLDKDHYNWLPEIFKYHDYRQNINKVIIIGEKESLGTEVGDGTDKKKTKANLLGWITSLEREGIPVEFYSNYDDPALQTTIPVCGKNILNIDLMPSILTANVCNKDGFAHAECGINERKNANSLVLKLNHGTCSVILPGDALGVTTDDIINKDPPVDHNATVLLTSHHGSDSHGSNSDEWIKSVNPKIALFSAGRYPHYNHPSSVVVDRLSNPEIAPQLLTSVPNHMLSYYNGSIFHMTPVPAGITHGIFSTFNAGDIHIRFQDEQFDVRNTVGFNLLPPTPCGDGVAATVESMESDFDF